MSEAFERMVAQARALPDEDQERLAGVMRMALKEAISEARWDELLARPESQHFLDGLSRKAKKELRKGETRPLADLLKT